MFFWFYCIRLWNVGCDGKVRQATWCVRSEWCLRHILQVPVTPRHQPGSSHPIRSASCHTQTITARRLRFFGHIVRSNSGPQAALNAGIDIRRPAEGLETTSRSSSTNVAAYNRERPETTEPWSVPCGLSGTEHKNYDRELSCVKLWKRQRSCSGTLHAAADDDGYV